MSGLPTKDNPDYVDTGDWGVSGTGISGLANRTQANVENAYKSQVQSSPQWANASQSMFAGLFPDGATPFPVLLLKALFEALTGLVYNGVETFIDILVALGDWLNDRWNDLLNVIQSLTQIGQVLVGAVVNPVTSVVQAFVDWVADLLGFRRETVVNQENLANMAIANFTGYARNPAWVSMHPISDVSFIESLFIQWMVWGQTETSSGHSHTIDGNRVTAELPMWIIENSDGLGCLIPAERSVVYDTCSVIMQRYSGTPSNVYVEVWRILEDGGATRVWISNDVSGLLTNAPTRYEFQMPSTIAVAGEKHLVCVKNMATDGSQILVLGISQGPYAVDIGAEFRPASINATTMTPQQVSAAMGATGALIWAALSAVNPAQDDQAFYDDFNRSSLGSLWVTASNTGNHIQLVNGEARFRGTTDGHQSAIYIRATASDAQRVEGRLITYQGVVDPHVGLMMHCARDGSQVVCLMVNDTSCGIFSGNIGNVSLRASKAVGGSGTWSMYWDVERETYVVLKNDEPIGLEWTPSQNQVNIGPQYRFGGIRITRAFFSNGGAVDDWSLKDWQPSLG